MRNQESRSVPVGRAEAGWCPEGLTAIGEVFPGLPPEAMPIQPPLVLTIGAQFEHNAELADVGVLWCC